VALQWVHILIPSAFVPGDGQFCRDGDCGDVTPDKGDIGREACCILGECGADEYGEEQDEGDENLYGASNGGRFCPADAGVEGCTASISGQYELMSLHDRESGESIPEPSCA